MHANTTQPNPITQKAKDNNKFYNRSTSILFTIPELSQHYYLDIHLNKNNILFDMNCEEIGDYRATIYRNLDNVFFVQNYLSIQNNFDKYNSIKKNTPKIDGRNVLSNNGIPTTDKAVRILSESVKYGKDNLLQYNVYQLKDFGDQYTFVFITRTKYFKNKDQKVIRTAAVEIRKPSFVLDKP